MNEALVLQLLLGLLDRATQIGALLATARKEGRDVSDSELDALAAKDDQARADLDAAIKAARG